MKALLHKYIHGDSAVKISATIEDAVRDGRIPSGEQLPTVRDLAQQLGVSPTTVAAAYQTLRIRGLVYGQGRRGTRVSQRPAGVFSGQPPLPAGVINLSDGNPDPALLPDLAAGLAAINTRHCLYGDPPQDDRLVALSRKHLADDGVSSGPICVVNGALDGIERVVAEHLRPGDRVGVEDPGCSCVVDLMMARGLHLEPLPLDDQGVTPDGIAAACGQGIQALVVTPRAQSPTGAGFTPARIRELRRVLRRFPDVLIIEDDHASWISDVALEPLHDAGRARWALVRSYCKALGPDLRLAILTGDERTMQRVHERLILGERWVSNILQRLAVALLSDRAVQKVLRTAARTYTHRRTALLTALASAGVPATAPGGYNVWVSVADEASTVQSILAGGYAVAAGERFRIRSPRAIRITTAALGTDRAEDVARAVAEAVRPAALAPRV